MRGCRQLLLLADATAMRNSVILVRAANEAEDIGSFGGLNKACNTADNLHEGASRLPDGRLLAMPLISWAMSLLEPTVEPSGKPSWTAAISNLQYNS